LAIGRILNFKRAYARCSQIRFLIKAVFAGRVSACFYRTGEKLAARQISQKAAWRIFAGAMSRLFI
jgi:hypothetical protein